jgi:hypothetical protein
MPLQANSGKAAAVVCAHHTAKKLRAYRLQRFVIRDDCRMLKHVDFQLLRRIKCPKVR